MAIKKSNKRKSTKKKHHALNPFANPKIRREFIDVDYVDKLSDKEKDWLNKFMDEYNGANLDFKNSRKNLHKNKRLKKDCTDRVNARNRDIYAKAKVNNTLNYDITDITVETENIEDTIIDYIDSQKKKDNPTSS